MGTFRNKTPLLLVALASLATSYAQFPGPVGTTQKSCDELRAEAEQIFQQLTYNSPKGQAISMTRMFQQWLGLILPDYCTKGMTPASSLRSIEGFNPSSPQDHGGPLGTLSGWKTSFTMSAKTRRRRSVEEEDVEVEVGLPRAKRSVEAMEDDEDLSNMLEQTLREKRNADDANNMVDKEATAGLDRTKRFLHGFSGFGGGHSSSPMASLLGLAGPSYMGGKKGPAREISEADKMMNTLLLLSRIQKNNAMRDFRAAKRGQTYDNRLLNDGMYGDAYPGRRKRAAEATGVSSADNLVDQGASEHDHLLSRQKRFLMGSMFAEPGDVPVQPTFMDFAMGTATDPNTGKRLEFGGDYMKRMMRNQFMATVMPFAPVRPGKEPPDFVKNMAPLWYMSRMQQSMHPQVRQYMRDPGDYPMVEHYTAPIQRRTRSGYFGDVFPGKRRRRSAEMNAESETENTDQQLSREKRQAESSSSANDVVTIGDVSIPIDYFKPRDRMDDIKYYNGYKMTDDKPKVIDTPPPQHNHYYYQQPAPSPVRQPRANYNHVIYRQQQRIQQQTARLQQWAKALRQKQHQLQRIQAWQAAQQSQTPAYQYQPPAQQTLAYHPAPQATAPRQPAPAPRQPVVPRRQPAPIVPPRKVPIIPTPRPPIFNPPQLPANPPQQSPVTYTSPVSYQTPNAPSRPAQTAPTAPIVSQAHRAPQSSSQNQAYSPPQFFSPPQAYTQSQPYYSSSQSYSSQTSSSPQGYAPPQVFSRSQSFSAPQVFSPHYSATFPSNAQTFFPQPSIGQSVFYQPPPRRAPTPPPTTFDPFIPNPTPTTTKVPAKKKAKREATHPEGLISHHRQRRANSEPTDNGASYFGPFFPTFFPRSAYIPPRYSPWSKKSVFNAGVRGTFYGDRLPWSSQTAGPPSTFRSAFSPRSFLPASQAPHRRYKRSENNDKSKDSSATWPAFLPMRTPYFAPRYSPRSQKSSYSSRKGSTVFGDRLPWSPRSQGAFSQPGSGRSAFRSGPITTNPIYANRYGALSKSQASLVAPPQSSPFQQPVFNSAATARSSLGAYRSVPRRRYKRSNSEASDKRGSIIPPFMPNFFSSPYSRPYVPPRYSPWSQKTGYRVGGRGTVFGDRLPWSRSGQRSGSALSSFRSSRFPAIISSAASPIASFSKYGALPTNQVSFRGSTSPTASNIFSRFSAPAASPLRTFPINRASNQGSVSTATLPNTVPVNSPGAGLNPFTGPSAPVVPPSGPLSISPALRQGPATAPLNNFPVNPPPNPVVGPNLAPPIPSQGPIPAPVNPPPNPVAGPYQAPPIQPPGPIPAPLNQPPPIVSPFIEPPRAPLPPPSFGPRGAPHRRYKRANKELSDRNGFPFFTPLFSPLFTPYNRYSAPRYSPFSQKTAFNAGQGVFYGDRVPWSRSAVGPLSAPFMRPNRRHKRSNSEASDTNTHSPLFGRVVAPFFRPYIPPRYSSRSRKVGYAARPGSVVYGDRAPWSRRRNFPSRPIITSPASQASPWARSNAQSFSGPLNFFSQSQFSQPYSSRRRARRV